MAGQIGQYQQGSFSTPVNGAVADATVVLSNDNNVRAKHNSHDADATIHVQSSDLASRPAAGTAQRLWVTTDGLRAYLDSGSVWGELAYLSLAAGGTVAGATTFAALATFNAGVTATQVSVTAGSSSPGSLWKSATIGLVLQGATGSSYDMQIVGPSGSPILIVPTGTTTGAFQSAVTVANGLTVSSGTTAVQALTATSVSASGNVSTSTGTFGAAPNKFDIAGTGSNPFIDLNTSVFRFLNAGGSAFMPIHVAAVTAEGLITGNAGITATSGTFSSAVSVPNARSITGSASVGSAGFTTVVALPSTHGTYVIDVERSDHLDGGAWIATWLGNATTPVAQLTNVGVTTFSLQIDASGNIQVKDSSGTHTVTVSALCVS